MVEIILTATDTNRPGKYIISNISIKNEQYHIYQLFHRNNHTLSLADASDIQVCKDNQCNTKSLLDRGVSYKRAKLTNAHVYFNRYDMNNQYPLIFVLLFRDEERVKVYNKFSSRSQFNSKLSSGKILDISPLSNYLDENSIFQELLKENDLLTDLLTYDIGKKLGDSTVNNGKYNGNKIDIVDNSKSYPNISGYGFKRYKHTPQRNYISKNACVIFGSNLILGKSKKDISTMQNKKYQYISVYWSDQVKEPLLLDFNRQGRRSSNNSDFYYHKKENEETFWEKITQKTNVLDVNFDSTDIYSQLAKNVDSKFAKLLKNVRSQFQKTIFLITDMKLDYGQSRVTESFNESSKCKLINKDITPTDKTSECQCLNNTGFIVYEHDVSTSVSGIDGDKEKAEIRFLISKIDSYHYQEISLYPSGKNSGPVERLYHTSNNNHSYMYFYDKDPRPLLLSYNGHGYGATSKENYDQHKWSKISKSISYPCNNSGSNDELLRVLSDVSGFLNKVNLYNTSKYEVGKYQEELIEIDVTTTDLACYYKYEHKSSYGHRLGNIGYDNGSGKKGTLVYSNPEGNSILSSVICYYFKNDDQFANPLVVELEFKGGIKKYHKLASITPNYTWQLLDIKSVEGDKLYDELYTLNTNFNSSKNPKEDDCKPKSVNMWAITGGTIGSLAGAGALGGSGYFVYVKLLVTATSVAAS